MRSSAWSPLIVPPLHAPRAPRLFKAILGVSLGLLGVSCGDRLASESGTDADEDSTSAPTDGDEAGDSDGTGTGGMECSPLSIGPEELGIDESCEPQQDLCASGLKCSRLADDSMSQFVEPRCVPIAKDLNEVGDPCELLWQGPGQPVDNCPKGSFCCWRNPALCGEESRCIELCSKSLECADCENRLEPVSCWPTQGDPICSRGCSPLVGENECDEPYGCVPGLDGDRVHDHVCHPQSGSAAVGAEGESCLPNRCASGLVCIAEASYGALCDVIGADQGCCATYCDVTLSADPCIVSGQTCRPLYPEGHRLEHVGVCARDDTPLSIWAI